MNPYFYSNNQRPTVHYGFTPLLRIHLNSFSFLCSILEAVLLSVTPTFVNLKKQEGKKFANTLEELKQDVDKPLIAILTLNTVAHTVGAILVGVQAEVAYVELFGSNPEFMGFSFPRKPWWEWFPPS